MSRQPTVKEKEKQCTLCGGGEQTAQCERGQQKTVLERGAIHFIVKGTASRSLLSPLFFIKQLLLATKHRYSPDIFEEPFVFSNAVIDLPVYLPRRSGGILKYSPPGVLTSHKHASTFWGRKIITNVNLNYLMT